MDSAVDELLVYELQVRSANACDPSTAADACAGSTGPEAWTRALDSSCPAASELTRIRLGTFDDLIADTADPTVAVSLRYIDERVGANAVWLQPIFPNNDRRLLPEPCDVLGSPYAVRDYFHTRGTLSAACTRAGADEYAAVPCWGDDAFASFVDAAHARGIRVFLDVALNHFGHDYLFHDIAGARTVDEFLSGAPPELLLDFEATHDPALVWPTVAAGAADFDDREWAAAVEACPDGTDTERARFASTSRVAFADERPGLSCGAPLEVNLPAFYLGADNWSPARAESQTTTAYGWRDVKFLFHRGDNGSARREFLRVREYAFRIVNYWASRGVDGFRLDHATDGLSGMSADEWRYITEKVAWYSALRGQDRPIWLAEEFHAQDEMSEVADILTEGYLFGLAGRDRALDSAAVDAVVRSVDRFESGARVLTHLENHDELRLMSDTGWDQWTGLGAWALGASTRSTPMLLVGQEWGEPERLGFRRPHVLTGRFDGRAISDDAQALTAAYRRLIEARTAHPALRGASSRTLRPPTGIGLVEGALARVRWAPDGSVVLAVNNLWHRDVPAEWAIPSDLRAGLGIAPCERVQFRDVLTDRVVVPCTEAFELESGFQLWLSASDRVFWAELERCE